MGWYFDGNYCKGSSQDKKDYINKYLGEHFKALDISIQNNTAYCAVLAPNDTITAVVFLFAKDNGRLGAKVMDEDVSPYYYNCPKRILDKLTPTTNQHAINWRNNCNKPKV